MSRLPSACACAGRGKERKITTSFTLATPENSINIFAVMLNGPNDVNEVNELNGKALAAILGSTVSASAPLLRAACLDNAWQFQETNENIL